MEQQVEKTLAIYNHIAKDYAARTENMDMSFALMPFTRLIPAPAHILDAGCGAGRDSLSLRELGYDVTSYDASKELAKEAEKRLGSPVLVKRHEEIDWAGEFSGVWASATLLHLPRSSMAPVLSKFSRALKENGIVYISLKTGEGENIDSQGRGFTYYTEESFRIELEKVPSLEEILTFRNSDPMGRSSVEWLNMFLKKT